MAVRIWVGVMVAGALLAAAGQACAATPAELVEACTQKSGFGFTFGTSPPQGSVLLDSKLIVPADPAFAPFRSAQLSYYDAAAFLSGVELDAFYGSPIEAEKAMRDLVAAATADRRFPVALDWPSPIWPMGDDPHLYFFSAGKTADDLPTGLTFFVTRREEQVTVACIAGVPVAPEARSASPSSL